MEIDCLPVGGERVSVHRFGKAGARPRIYLQGALHADEVSATMALAGLVDLLIKAEAAGKLEGEVVVVPQCNPIGARQFVLGRHLGRFSLDGRNFNRGFPNIGAQMVAFLQDLGRPSPVFADAFRAGDFILEGLSQSGNPVERLQATLMRLAWGADVIIDVHADMAATLHLYTSPSSWPAFRSLARRLGIPVVILAETSADAPFDEVQGPVWAQVSPHLLSPVSPPQACTLELRGLSDVSPEVAASDARALYDFLADLGVVADMVPTAENPDPFVVTLDAVEVVKAPLTGAVMFLIQPGNKVRRGDCIARLYAPAADPAEPDWHEVLSGSDGFLFVRWHQGMIQAGMPLAKIATLGGGPPSSGSPRLSD
jgi:uncharacterized protein